MLHGAWSIMEHGACSILHALWRMVHAPCRMHYGAWSMLQAARRIRENGAFSMLHAPCCTEHGALWSMEQAPCCILHAGGVAKVPENIWTYKGDRGSVVRSPGFWAAVPPEKERIYRFIEHYGAWSMLHAACSMLHGAWSTMEHAPCYGEWCMLHAACIMEPGACSRQHAPCFTEHGALWSMAPCCMHDGAWSTKKSGMVG